MRLTDELRSLKDRVFHHLGPRHAEVLEGIAVAAEHKGPEPEEEEVETSGSAGETPAEEAVSAPPAEDRTTPGVISTPETKSSKGKDI